MRESLMAAAMLSISCAAHGARETVKAVPDAEMVAMIPEDLREEDMPPEVELNLRECDAGGVVKSIEGSFTGPGRAQKLISAVIIRCDRPGSRPERILVLTEGGKELARMQGGTATRALDVDGDGKDEWVEAVRDCRTPGGCSTSASIFTARRGGKEEVSDLGEVARSYCEGGTRSVFRTVVIRRTAGTTREIREERWAECT